MEADWFMGWYAKQLLRPPVKVFVVVAFAALLTACTFSMLELTQEFQVTDILPHDSYVTDYLEAAELYSNSSRALFQQHPVYS